MNKEEIFNAIDEYMELKRDNYRVKILGDRNNKNKAFYIIMIDSCVCGDGESYSINGIQRRMLDKNNIKYKLI